jgi:hypothetical protein
MRSRGPLRGGVVALLVVALAASAGCTRRFYRNRADKEVAAVLAHKDVVPDWQIEQYHVYPDPRARFADPTNPDRPPMPPDDPAARGLSPNPQKPPHKAGIARIEGLGYLDLLAAWDAENRAAAATTGDAAEEQDQPENTDTSGLGPDARQEIGIAKGSPEVGPEPYALEQHRPYLINLEQAVELGTINSREFQFRREDLYLAALPVTLERFAFAYQFFATGEAIREWTGVETSEGRGDRWRLNSNVGFQKLFSTGALLMLDFANRTVLELSDRRRDVSVSTINLDLVQPLLRGGGRAVTLEPLTQVERNLLYEIRDYARFRKEYYQYITGGGNLTDATGPTAVSEGFLPTVQRRFLIKIAQDNVRRLQDGLRIFQVLEEGDQMSKLQVDQVRLDLLSAQSQVLQRQQEYGDALDRFKQQLGVPPPTPLELEPGVIQGLLTQYDRFEVILKESEEFIKTLETYDSPDEALLLRGRIEKLFTESAVVRGAPRFRDTIEARWQPWRRPQLDDEKLEAMLTELRARRRKLLDLQTERELKEQTLTPQEQQELRDIIDRLSLGDLEEALRLYERRLWKKGGGELQALLFRNVRNLIAELLAEITGERSQRLSERWPVLQGVPIEGVDLAGAEEEDEERALEYLQRAMAVAVRTALANRLDLMNARADVVDAWRKIAVQANSLLGVFNVGYHMDSSTPPDEAKPFAFEAARTRHQLFFNAELPLVRLAERNNYRAALIAYQRSRRALQFAEDAIAAQVRAEVRQLQVLARNYVIQQRQVEMQFQQVELSLERLLEPPRPAAGGGAPGGDQVAATTNTQQLLTAYNRLASAQSQLLNTWVQYQIARQQMYLDLELLPLDYRGVWIDEHATRTPGPQPPPEPGQPEPEPERGAPPG